MKLLPAVIIQASLVALGLGVTLIPEIVEAQQTGTITLIGTVSSHCSIIVTPTTSAVNLDLDAGTKRIEVGSALQNCNKKAGFYLHVLSQNCGTGTLGAKLIGTVGAEVLRYSVEFNNPSTGGSQGIVAGLLANACSGAPVVTGREVSNEKVRDEISRIYVNYTGDNSLGADSYTDTLTITLVVK